MPRVELGFNAAPFTSRALSFVEAGTRSGLSLDQQRFFFFLYYLVPSRVERRPLEPRDGRMESHV